MVLCFSLALLAIITNCESKTTPSILIIEIILRQKGKQTGEYQQVSVIPRVTDCTLLSSYEYPFDIS